MHRFYIYDASLDTKTFQLSHPDEVHHLKNVLRLKVDSRVELFNSQGEVANAIIKKINPKTIDLNIQSTSRQEKKGPKIILCCAMPKKSKFEIIIEKATELGVSEIYPMQTKRTEVILKDEKEKRKHKRFESIALNASKQSKSSIVPSIHHVQSFKKTIESLASNTSLIIPSLESSTQPIIEVLSKITLQQPIAFFIGPEGDFTPQEYTLAKEKGAIAVSLGPTILRVETAAISTMAAANFVINT